MNFNQMMLAFEHTLHSTFQQYAYLPLILFLVAITIVVAAFNAKQSATRYASAALALALLVVCIFV